jgi:uncharacterized membrane protein YphA (DoxX/SURF4 family)
MGFSERIERHALPYALGAIGLGVVTLAVRDFALQWQPVPDTIPAREPLALLSGALLVAGGAAAVWRQAGKARLILPAFYLLWVLALHLPRFIAAPGIGSALGPAEILSLAAAGALLVPGRHASVAIRVFGLCPLVFGASHLAYADFTASMVPGWIPGPLFWAYFTGAAHIAAGLAIASGFQRRLAATLLTAMCAGFVLLLHVPRVAAAPDSRLEWTMFCVALSITGAAWLVARAAR